MKKHFSQMSAHEESFIAEQLLKNICWNVTDYARERITERGISDEDLLLAINDGKVIEYHKRNKNHRILIRGNQIVNKKHVVCVVVEPMSGFIVTAYLNDYDDTHKSIRMSAYDHDINIIKEMRGAFK